ncbi:MAG: hypothetical protein ACE5HL_12580 [Terriglobia bacterium]
MGKKKGKGRRRDIWYLRLTHPDGFEEPVGSIGLRESIWHIRYFSSEGHEVEESANTEDKDAAALFLLSRSQEERRKLDAEVLLAARNRLKDLSEPETRRFVSHGLFDAMVDTTTRASHRALEGGIAPWEWWEGPGRAFIPPLGFGCRCSLIGVNGPRAQRMIECGEAFDLTRGLPVDAQAGPDRQWQLWSETLLQSWDEVRRKGLDLDEAKERALVAANASLPTDRGADLEALRWIK